MLRDVDHERRRVSLRQVLREQKHAWHGVKLNQPDWSPFSHSLAIGGELKSEGVMVDIIFNAYWEALDFELPILRDGTQSWRRWIDTALDPPNEICEWGAEKPVLGTTYRAGARSVVVLLAGEAVYGGHFRRQCDPNGKQDEPDTADYAIGNAGTAQAAG
jgi:glycogen operon protein